MKVNVMNKMMMKKMKSYRTKSFESYQFSSGEMICGSVKIDDSSSYNNTSIKQYISMINDEMNDMLKH